MPRYDYTCLECDYVVELARTFGDDTPVLCRVCSAVMRKVYAATPTHFKGTGWGKDK